MKYLKVVKLRLKETSNGRYRYVIFHWVMPCKSISGTLKVVKDDVVVFETNFDAYDVFSGKRNTKEFAIRRSSVPNYDELLKYIGYDAVVEVTCT